MKPNNSERQRAREGGSNSALPVGGGDASPRKAAFIKTYGCQMNEQDSLQMRGLLGRLGYDATGKAEEADFILINSCSIREKAVHKIYSDLGRVRHLAEENPNLIVGLSGCVAQQEKENLSKRFPFLDMVFGPDAIRHLPEMVEEVRKKRGIGERQTILRTQFDSRQDFEFVNLLPVGDENRVKAFVNIQKGCDNVCAFCIVPRVRGGEVSRPSADIIKEVAQLVEMGVKEVTLLGQNVNSYGLKNTGELSFSQLLNRVATETGIKRLRFTTSHPKDVGEDLIRQYAELPNLSPHLHLPVQSGSNRVLEAMRRQYTREHYLDIIKGLKQARPEMAFTTDVIVGFPGETEEDFEATLSLMKEVGYDLSYSFIYSPRPGTTALRLADDVTLKEKEGRLARLLKLQDELSRASNLPLEGSVQEVLVESFDEVVRTYKARTPANKIVHFAGEDDGYLGEMLTVEITKAHAYSLTGVVGADPCVGPGADTRVRPYRIDNQGA